MAQHVCIIGGNGFVGRAIVDQAVEAGHHVTVGCRYPERARDLLVKGVQLAQVDVVEGHGLDEAVAGADTVIYLPGLLFERGRQTFAAVHRDGIEKTITACRSAGVRQLLHMSALGAGQVPESAYATTKAEAEALVRASGLAWTIFRPSIIYGEGDSFFTKFKSMSALLPVLPVIAGDTRFQPIWVNDVARAFVRSIGDRHVNGHSFDLGGPKQYTFRALLELLLATLGRDRLLIPLPNFAAKMMAILSAPLPTPPITLDQLRLLNHDNIVQGEPFPAQFGQAASVEEVLPTYILASTMELKQRQLDRARRHYRKGTV